MYTKIKLEIAEDVKLLLQDIQQRLDGEFDVFIAGGYLRDLYCNKPIKDLDIFFVPCDDKTKDVSYIPAKFYINYNKRLSNLTNTSDMASRGVSQVIGLFNSKLSTPEVQFIVYGKHLTMQEVAKDMDMGINQIVYYHVREGVYATEAFIKGHEDKVIECLHEYDVVRTYDRYCRMEAKFSDYRAVGKPDHDVLPIDDQLSAVCGTYRPRTPTGSMVDS